MESELFASCQISDQRKRAVLVACLTEETRPLLEDDLAAEDQYLFDILDSVETPEIIETVGDDLIVASWFIGGGFFESDVKLTISALKQAGCENIYGAVSVDGKFISVVRIIETNIEKVSWYSRKEMKEIQYAQEGDIGSFLNEIRKMDVFNKK